MADDASRTVRVLIADGTAERLAEIARTVAVLGHEVVGEGTSLETVAQATATELADVALVIVGDHSDYALDMIRSIVHEAACPVIAILDVQDRAFIDRAARLGIFSYIVHAGDPQELQSAMDVALQRFAEYHALEGAFGRRAVTERAKGILMERHSVDEAAAFDMLREHSRSANRKLIDVATAVVDGHMLLPAKPRGA